MAKSYLKPVPVTKYSKLSSLVENRTAHSFNFCELSLFETHQRAEQVYLEFSDFVLTSMIRGKKVMSLKEKVSFDYFPGESVILPPSEGMTIDFPEASKQNPTQCLALTISQDLIRQTVGELNEVHTKADSWGDWHVDLSLFHLSNNQELTNTIDRIVTLTRNEQGKAKELMIEYTLKEMLVRLMQTQAKVLLHGAHSELSSNNSLAAVVSHIKAHATEKIELNRLAEKACMSRASFFKKFKEALGETPAQFLLKERIRIAKKKLRERDRSVTQVCFESGFENLSHFTKSFKQEVGMSPKTWKESVNPSINQ